MKRALLHLLRLFLRLFRSAAVLVLVVFLLIASNVAVLVWDVVYDAARGVLVSALPDGALPVRSERRKLQAEYDALVEERRRLRTQGTAREAETATLRRDLGERDSEAARLRQSLRRADSEVSMLNESIARLDAERSRFATRIEGLNSSNIRLRRNAQRLAGRVDADAALRSRALEISGRISSRTRRAVMRDFSGMGAEAIPYIGAGAIVGLTILEVRDACASMRDMRELTELFSGEGQEGLPMCGYTAGEFWAALRGGEGQLDCRDIADLVGMDSALECVDVVMPWERQEEAAAAAMSIGRMPWETDDPVTADDLRTDRKMPWD